jgi:Glycosyltransferase family 87
MTRPDGRSWLIVSVGGAVVLAGVAACQLPGWMTWPPILVWAILVGVAGLLVQARTRRLEPAMVLAVLVVCGWLVVDLTFLAGQALRDLDLYLKAGLHFRLGQPVYLDGLVTSRPADPTDYPYVYPPPTLPLAALLSSLPRALVAAGWVAALIGAAFTGFGRIGLAGWWRIVFFAWPPFAEGLYVGNVAVVLFLLVALAPWSSVGLILGPLLKPASALLALWPIAERRWRELAMGLVLVGAIVLVSLPLTGTQAWSDWLSGLGWYARSQPFVPATFYGIALDRYLPTLLVALIGLGLLLLAGLARGRELLGRLGVVSVAVSPSLYAHGFDVALPALLELRALGLWAALAFTAGPLGPAWFGLLVIVVIGWFIPGLRRLAADEPAHPLGRAVEPWPAAPSQGWGKETAPESATVKAPSAISRTATTEK